MGLYYRTASIRKKIKNSPYHRHLPFLPYWYLFDRPKAIRLSELNAIYIPIPKVACRSIKFTLAQHIGLKGNPHTANWDYVPLATVNRQTGFFRFAYVRNPLDRLLSCYAQKIVQFRKEPLRDGPLVFWKYGDTFHRDMEFGEFVRQVAQIPDRFSDPHFRSQHQFLLHRGKLAVDFLGRFESLQEDWDAVASRTALPPLPQQNRSKHRPYQEEYTPELARIACERYRQDVHLFEYADEITALL